MSVKGTHAYIGLNKAGVIRAFVMDDPGDESDTAALVTDWIKMGRDEWRLLVSKVKTMGGPWYKLDLERAKERYLSGWTLERIADAEGVHLTTVHRQLLKAGVVMRDASKRQVTWARRKKAAQIIRLRSDHQ